RAFESKHTSVTITRSTFEETLPKIVKSLEEPIAASSIVPMYFVCQRAREDVKVALVGQGPDELFGGYRRHLGVRYGAMWARLPAWMRRPISSTVGALPRNETLKRGVHSLAIPDRMRRYQNVLSLLPEGQVEGLPANFKVRNGSRKWLHRQVCATFLPESILKRPKRGFAVNVVDAWFQGAMDNKMADTLRDSGSKIYQYLRPTAVSELFEQHS